MKYNKKLINSNIKLFYKIVNKLDKDVSNNFLKGILLNEYNINDFEIIKNENGKPFLKDISLYFNISHKKNIVGIAISNFEIGLDIEYIDNSKKISKTFLNNVFTKEEIKYINNDIEKLLILWTKKESIIKLLGSKVAYIKDVNLKDKSITQDTFFIDRYVFTVSYYNKK